MWMNMENIKDNLTTILMTCFHTLPKFGRKFKFALLFYVLYTVCIYEISTSCLLCGCFSVYCM